MDIKLTLAERLVLANQYEILCELRNDPYAKRLAENLRNGYEFLYRDVLESVSPEMDKASTEFVLDTLSMYQAIKNSWKTLASRLKSRRLKSIFLGSMVIMKGAFTALPVPLQMITASLSSWAPGVKIRIRPRSRPIAACSPYGRSRKINTP